MKRPTIASLQAQIDNLTPYQYLAWALLKGEKPTVFRSENEDQREASYGFEVAVYAPAASHGGIVVIDGSAHFLERWSIDAQRNSDSYITSLARKVWKFHVDVVKAKYGDQS